MKSQFIKFFAATLIAVVFTSCATTPNIQVPRPWTRTLGQAQILETGSSIYINVSGNEQHLLLDNTLVDNSIYSVIKEQLNRRNFEIINSKNEADYILNVNYQSEDVKEMKTEFSSFQSSYQESASTLGYGVLAALAVAEQASSNIAASKAKVTTQTAYHHTLGLSIIQNEEMIWTGESIWKSSNIDISNRIVSVTQLLISELPGYGEITPSIKAVNPEKKNNYFNLFIKGNSFVGPSLPYSINFMTSTSPSSEEPTLDGISNPRILHAVVDLIQTAEFSLPINPNYENPLEVRQWAKVKLGGKYYIGNDNQISYIIVEMKGDKSGYKIDHAYTVNNQEYKRFLEDLKKWQNALTAYFNVFE